MVGRGFQRPVKSAMQGEETERDLSECTLSRDYDIAGLRREGGNVTDEIIGMKDMIAIYEVTDRFGIDRESISVPLEKAEAGGVSRQSHGGIEVIVPADIPIEQWLPTLEGELEMLGFALEDVDEDEG